MKKKFESFNEMLRRARLDKISGCPILINLTRFLNLIVIKYSTQFLRKVNMLIELMIYFHQTINFINKNYLHLIMLCHKIEYFFPEKKPARKQNKLELIPLLRPFSSYKVTNKMLYECSLICHQRSTLEQCRHCF